MEIDHEPPIYTLPLEVLLAVVHYSGCSGRRVLPFVSRHMRYACQAYLRDKPLAISPAAPPHPFGWRQNVMAYGGSNPDRWCQMADAPDLRIAHWVFHATIQPFFLYQPAPAKLFAALPPTLHTLELEMHCPLGEYMLRSLCASLCHARALTSFKVGPIGGGELVRIIEGLSVRGRDNTAAPLREFDVRVHSPDASKWPRELDVSGLRWLTDLAVTVVDGTRADEAACVEAVVIGALDAGAAPMRSFSYTGPPLRDTAQWTRMVYRSAATLRNLVMPVFAPMLAPTDAEMAVGVAGQLESLTVLWQSARLDYMLGAKPYLKRIHHYGAVMGAQFLVPQLSALQRVEEFYLAASVDAGFVAAMAKSIRWSECHTVVLGGADATINNYVRDAVRQHGGDTTMVH